MKLVRRLKPAPTCQSKLVGAGFSLRTAKPFRTALKRHVQAALSAAALRAAALSVFSQVKLGNSRPKWPCRAVSR